VKTSDEVLIVGGGIIGVCSAYFLARKGRQVTLVEQGDIGSGCSYGNAGLIVPSHSIPLAAPGVLSQGMKWLLDAESPFYIKPRLNSALISWLWQFRAYCKEEPMRKALPLLRDMQRESLALYDEIVKRERLTCDFEQSGNLALFKTQPGFRAGLHEARLLQEFGLLLEILDAAAVRDQEPAVHPDIAGGIYFQEDARLDPALFVQNLAQKSRDCGAKLDTKTRVLGFTVKGRRISEVKTTRGDYSPDQVVLAAGAWSPEVVRDLRLRLPIQPAKGYSITVNRPDKCPRTPLMLGEAKVGVTPLKSALRFAGTLELAGFDMTINQRRVNAIWRAAADYLAEPGEMEVIEIWRGLRPCTPDGLPLLGRSRIVDNLIVATGHAMLGVSLGPITGALVAQIVDGKPPTMDLSALKVERFGG